MAGSMPLLERPIEGRIFVQMPYRKDNRAWIKDVCGDRTRPEWVKTEQHWEIARAHSMILLHALLDRFGRVEFCREYRPMERCTETCLKARRDECTCSCLGEHHGSGALGGGWMSGLKQVGDYAVVAYGNRQWARVVLTREGSR